MPPGASGNVATEDVIHLCHSLGFETGISLPALLPLGTLLSEALPTFTTRSRVAQAMAAKAAATGAKERR